MNSSKKNILLVFDKFKDTLNSRTLSKLVSTSLVSNFPEKVTTTELPISDGGEGFVDCMQ